MPPLPAVASCLKVDQHFAVGSDVNALVRLHFLYTGAAPTSANCVTLANAVQSSGNTNLKALYSSAGGLINAVVTDLASSSGAQGTSASGWSGTRAGSSLSNGTAALINHHIARRYRGGKPRSYFPFGTASDMNSSGTWASAFQTAVNSGFAAFVAGIVGQVAGSTTVSSLVNVSYYNGFTSVQNPITHRWRNVPTLRGTPVTDVITSSTINPQPGSQRRRNGA